MPKPVPVAPELKALSELLQSAYSATNLGQIARGVRNLAQQALPATVRVQNQLDDLERHLVIAFEDLYLASLQPAFTHGSNPSLSERMRTAGSYYMETLESAARMLDRQVKGAQAAAVLRAAAGAMADAARSLARRRGSELALEIGQDYGRLGAPACLLFGLDGRMLWSNHALTELTESRGLARADVHKAAAEFAAPLTSQLRARGEPTSRAELRKRVPGIGLHFRAGVKRRGGDGGEALLLVEVSEAKRTTELSPREIQVAKLVSSAHSYKETAKLSNVSIDSVRTYIRRIYRKFGVTSRLQLKARLIREGMLRE